jgi:hypothetical protein
VAPGQVNAADRAACGNVLAHVKTWRVLEIAR